MIDILDKVAPDDIIGVLSVANLCSKSCERLLARCIEIIVKSDVDVVTLEKALPQEIVQQIIDSRLEFGCIDPESTSSPDKHVKRIYRALDSDDVELLRMLLKEGHTTLDDAYALHYAVAFADAKTTTELLDLGLADVNHRNHRGYTVLHIAAMRKEPKIIVSLLTKGARPADVTPDHRNALQIAKRLTRAVDYHKSTEEGKPSPKDQLCIEVLEQAERPDPLIGEASVSLAMAGDELRMRLLYLENRGESPTFSSSSSSSAHCILSGIGFNILVLYLLSVWYIKLLLIITHLQCFFYRKHQHMVDTCFKMNDCNEHTFLSPFPDPYIIRGRFSGIIHLV